MAVTLDVALDSDYESPSPVGLTVHPRGAQPQSAPTASRDEPFLNAHALVNDGYVEQVQFEGRHVRSREMKAVTIVAQAHPEWTDSELEIALRNAGAKFPPSTKAAFMEAVHLDRFTPLLGKMRQIDVKFRWRQGSEDLGSQDIITPYWQVSVDAVVRARRRCYSLSFEPLSGAFNGLTSHSCV
jgi:hypothetical protein